MICVNHIRCSPRPFVDRPNYDLTMVFFVALRGPPWTKGSCSRRCSSPRPSVSSVDKCVAVAVLRVPSWPFVDKKGVVPSWTDQIMIWQRFSSWPFAALRGQMCCRCSSSCSFAALRGQKRCSPRPFLDKPYSHIALHSRTTSITDETWNWNRWNSCIIMA